MIQRFLYYVPAVAWAIFTYSLSTNRPPDLSRIAWLSPDKFGHLGFYAIFTVLMLWGYLRQASPPNLSWAAAAVAVVIAGGYGAALEGVQAAIPYRSFDYADMVANIIGSLLGALLVRFWYNKKQEISV